MIVEEEVYLEHFGVKGMRWGVRKDHRTEGEKIVSQLRTNAAMVNPSQKKFAKEANKATMKRARQRYRASPEGKAQRRKQIKLAAIGGAVAVGVAGGVMAKSLMNQYGGVKLKAADAPLRRGNVVTRHLMHKTGPVKTVNINPNLRERALRARAASASGNDAKVMKRVAANHLESTKKANDTLKSWYNQNNVPIPKREFIDTGYWEGIVNR